MMKFMHENYTDYKYQNYVLSNRLYAFEYNSLEILE